MLMKKNKLILFLIFFIALVSYYFIGKSFYKLDISKNYIYPNKNFQTLECIDEKLLVVEDNGDIFEFKEGNLKFIFSLNRKEASSVKQRQILVHTNSLVKFKDNKMYASNSIKRLPASILSFKFTEAVKKGFISEDNMKIIQRVDGIKSIHIEEFIPKYTNKKFLIKFEKKDTNNFYDASLHNSNFTLEICDLNIFEKQLQNLYFDQLNSSLYVVKNIFAKRGAQINIYNLINQNNEICPQITKHKIKRFITMMELEAFEKCNGIEYYLLINNKKKQSVILQNSMTNLLDDS
jgi:hypothetical protein